MGDRFGFVDTALQSIEDLVIQNILTNVQEEILVEHVLNQRADVLLLLKHYATSPIKLLLHLNNRQLLQPSSLDASNNHKQQQQQQQRQQRPLDPDEYDAIVVGAGLAGLTTAVTLVDRGAKVLIIEKNGYSGGNSAYASSGLNAVGVGSQVSKENTDTLDIFTKDTLRSSGTNSTSANMLAPILTQGSYEGLEWIRNRVGLPLDQKGQLGGHTHARTWRPEQGMAGAEIIFALNRITKHLIKNGGAIVKDATEEKNQGANKGSSSSLVAKTGSLEMLYKTKLEKITTTIVEKENVVAGISMINVKTGLER